MKITQRTNTKKTRPKAFLYTLVFQSAFSMCLVVLLFFSFLLQPVHEAMAAEDEADTSPAETEEPVAADVAEQESAPEPAVDETAEATEPEPETTNEETAAETESTDNDEYTTGSVEAETNEEPEIADDTVENAIDADSVATNTDTTNQPAETVVSNADTATTTEDTPDTEVEEEADSQASSSLTTNSSTSNTSTSTPSPGPATTTATSTDESTPTDTTGGSGGSGGTDDDVSSDDASDTSDQSDTSDTESDEVSSGGSGDDDSSESENDTGDSQVSTDSENVAAETTDEVNVDATTATSGSEASEPVSELNYTVTNDNFYQFSKQSCVAVGDGTYHCTERSASETPTASAVYAELGASGNLEIFMQTSDGETKQLTDNNRDDQAPHFDSESMQIVWQRMVDSRYQIIVYDVAGETETQLTFSRHNNMEPKVSPDGIVWQAWDGNDWEIMYFDGTYTDQITDNDAQDVTPVIRDGYIVWSVLGGEEQLARVFEIATGETMSITGHEGGAVTNPRFVLVYDTQFENGDIITQGFDPETGIARPIAAQPGQNPVDLPEPDPVGETVALIQNKSSSKDDKDGLGVVTAGDGATATSSAASSTASTTDTLRLDSVDTDTSTTTTASTIEDTASTTAAAAGSDFELTEFDLVIVEQDGEIHSTSTPREVPEIDREVMNAEIASSTQQ